MTTPGFFEIYPDARPALPAGTYTTTSHQDLTAAPPVGTDGHITVDDTQFYVHIDSPRYAMPPDQILSTFPPAGAHGDWRERLPQIVLKRRTLPYERNPGPLTAAPPIGPPPPDPDPATAPPWLALVVIADGEARLSSTVDVTQCVTPGLVLDPDADVPTGQYLEVSQDIVNTVFPCQDELALLTHVRKVDLRDTELALSDDDGYLAVVLANRLPQPGPPLQPGGDPTPLKYTACLINLERQLPRLAPTEPAPVFHFDAVNVTDLVDTRLLEPAPNATVDQIAMNLAPVAGTAPAPFAPPARLETAAAAWSTGPARTAPQRSGDLNLATGLKFGLDIPVKPVLPSALRFPVLVSWDFTCTADGGFEHLMKELDVGLLGTLDEEQPPPVPEVAATGHVALAHRTRRGEPTRSWYRGPLGPQPTQRTVPTDGVLPLAHTGDQLRKLVPDGREDISLAAIFEIGRLLTLAKPALVAALMQWRRELFGAARARELAQLLAGGTVAGIGVGAIGGRDSLDDLIRTHFVSAYVAAQPGSLAPRAQVSAASRVPAEVAALGAAQMIAGLGADPEAVLEAGKKYGVDGLGMLPVPVAAAPSVPVSRDQAAQARLRARQVQRVQQLVADVLKSPDDPKDTLDRLIERAEGRP
jgi:hypothetical protein